MPKVSKATATAHYEAPGLMDAYQQEVDGYVVEIERWDVDMDFAFALNGLPNNECPASHLGFVLKGSLTIQSADGEEVFEAGDAVVLKPGHTPRVAAGTEWVMFTPTEEANAMAPVVQANMMKYAEEHGIQVQQG